MGSDEASAETPPVNNRKVILVLQILQMSNHANHVWQVPHAYDTVDATPALTQINSE